jgi:hypothetical protein
MTPLVRNADGTNRRSGSLLFSGSEHTLDRGRAVVVRNDLSAELDEAVDGRRTEIVDGDRGRSEPNLRLSPNVSLLPLIGTGDCRADAVTIEKRGDDPAVEEMLGTSGIFVTGIPFGNGSPAIPITLEVQPHWVIRSAAPAVVADHFVLDRFDRHRPILPLLHSRGGDQAIIMFTPRRTQIRFGGALVYRTADGQHVQIDAGDRGTQRPRSWTFGTLASPPLPPPWTGDFASRSVTDHIWTRTRTLVTKNGKSPGRGS